MFSAEDFAEGSKTISIWTDGACIGMDPDLFLGEAVRTKEEEALAKAACDNCLVRQECLDYALENNERNGIWGGTNEEERRSIPNYR